MVNRLKTVAGVIAALAAIAGVAQVFVYYLGDSRYVKIKDARVQVLDLLRAHNDASIEHIESRISEYESHGLPTSSDNAALRRAERDRQNISVEIEAGK